MKIRVTESILHELAEEDRNETEMLLAVCKAVNKTIAESGQNRTVLKPDGIYSRTSDGTETLLKSGDFRPISVTKNKS